MVVSDFDQAPDQIRVASGGRIEYTKRKEQFSGFEQEFGRKTMISGRITAAVFPYHRSGNDTALPARWCCNFVVDVLGTRRGGYRDAAGARNKNVKSDTVRILRFDGTAGWEAWRHG